MIHLDVQQIAGPMRLNLKRESWARDRDLGACEHTSGNLKTSERIILLKKAVGSKNYQRLEIDTWQLRGRQRKSCP